MTIPSSSAIRILYIAAPSISLSQPVPRAAGALFTGISARQYQGNPDGHLGALARAAAFHGHDIRPVKVQPQPLPHIDQADPIAGIPWLPVEGWTGSSRAGRFPGTPGPASFLLARDTGPGSVKLRQNLGLNPGTVIPDADDSVPVVLPHAEPDPLLPLHVPQTVV